MYSLFIESKEVLGGILMNQFRKFILFFLLFFLVPLVTNALEEVTDDFEEGRISNPRMVGSDDDIIIRIEESDYWDNAGSNKCYYFKFDYTDKSDSSFARYKITSNASGSIRDYIFLANGPNFELNASIVDDVKNRGVFGVSMDHVYAICNGFGKQFQFEYLDSEPLNVRNSIQQEFAENQIGKGNTVLYDEAFISENDLCQGDRCDISFSEICENVRVLNTLKFVGIILFVIKIFVPVLIIILGSVDFAKAMVEGKNDEIQKKIPILVKRVITGIVVFFIPSIINFLFSVIDTYSETMQKYENCRVCIFDPDECRGE